jgi:hypothetical protein
VYATGGRDAPGPEGATLDVAVLDEMGEMEAHQPADVFINAELSCQPVSPFAQLCFTLATSQASGSHCGSHKQQHPNSICSLCQLPITECYNVDFIHSRIQPDAYIADDALRNRACLQAALIPTRQLAGRPSLVLQLERCRNKKLQPWKHAT